MGCFHQTPPLKTQRSMQEKRQKDCNSQRLWMSLWKQYLPFITGRKHIGTQRNCDSLHRFVADKIPVWREEIRHKIPSLTKKLFAIKYLLRKGKQIFTVEYHWMYQPESRAGPMLRSSQSTQNGLHVLFCLCVCS